MTAAVLFLTGAARAGTFTTYDALEFAHPAGREWSAGVLAGWRAGVSPAFARGGEDAASPAAETAALLP